MNLIIKHNKRQNEKNQNNRDTLSATKNKKKEKKEKKLKGKKKQQTKKATKGTGARQNRNPTDAEPSQGSSSGSSAQGPARQQGTAGGHIPQTRHGSLAGHGRRGSPTLGETAACGAPAAARLPQPGCRGVCSPRRHPRTRGATGTAGLGAAAPAPLCPSGQAMGQLLPVPCATTLLHRTQGCS